VRGGNRLEDEMRANNGLVDEQGGVYCVCVCVCVDDEVSLMYGVGSTSTHLFSTAC